MANSETLKSVTLLSRAKIDGKIQPAGWQGEVSGEAFNDLIRLNCIDGKDDNSSLMTDEERDAFIHEAVKGAAEKKPERTKQPTQKDVEAIAGFDVSAKEIGLAFAEIKKASE